MRYIKTYEGIFDFLKKVDLYRLVINYHIKQGVKKADSLLKSEDFFLDHPEDEIRDYITDLGDALGDNIELVKNYEDCCWNMNFQVKSRAHLFADLLILLNEIEDQVKSLEELLDSVNLTLLDSNPDRVDSDHYNFLICKKK